MATSPLASSPLELQRVGRHILVVDDHTRFAAILRTAIIERGHECVALTTVAAALEALATQTFDVVVSDKNVGGQNGTRLLREVALRSPTSRRVMMSGSGPVEEADLQIPHAFLVKPFNLDQLFAAIEQA
jgi:DNA-binding NtrC family response regulator